MTDNHFAGQVPWPVRVGLPPPLAHCLQDRAESRQLASATAGTVVLSGLGGVGKSQLAAQLAEARWAAGEVDLLV